MKNTENAAVQQELLSQYRVVQKGVVANTPVVDFESLVTHHPGDNSGARVVDGVVVRGEQGRRHAVIGSEIQEIEVAVPGRAFGLKSDQVMIKKDFILEDSSMVSGVHGVRDVDVPSPLAGYIGRVDKTHGLVDIYDREGGDVIARIRHMSDIPVSTGNNIEYGQALGTQSNVGTKPIHVHMEMDTRYFQQYENYIADLTSGRLAIDPNRRAQGIEPLPVVDDGTFRIGESGDRVRDLQRLLTEEGYRGRDGQPIMQDGVIGWACSPRCWRSSVTTTCRKPATSTTRHLAWCLYQRAAKWIALITWTSVRSLAFPTCQATMGRHRMSIRQVCQGKPNDRAG